MNAGCCIKRYLQILDDFFDDTDDLGFVIFCYFDIIEESIYGLEIELPFLFDDFFEFREIIMDDKNVIVDIIAWLLFDEN